MNELTFHGVKIRFSFWFFATAALLIFSGEGDYPILGLYACIIHETGHLLAMIVFGVRVRAVEFYGAGIKITHEDMSGLNAIKRAVIILGGCAVNLLGFLIFYFLLNTGEKAEVFAAVNFVLMIFNLIPLKCFDGGKLAELVSERLLSVQKSLKFGKVLEIITILLTALSLIIAIYIGGGNFSLYTTLVYFVISTVLM